MIGPIQGYLSDDHERLGGLLKQALAGPGEIARGPYEAFRAGLLRHIGIEEKILFPAARRLTDGSLLPVIAHLHRGHAALSALLIPTPTRALLLTIEDLLQAHNAIEEGQQGIYQLTDRLSANTAALIEELRAAPEVRVAPHFDTPTARANLQVLLKALEASSPD